MEKISKILPGNARIQTVDLSKNKNNRHVQELIKDGKYESSMRLPGAHLSALERLELSEQKKQFEEMRRASIAQNLGDQFFKPQVKMSEGVMSQPESILDVDQPKVQQNSQNKNVENSSSTTQDTTINGDQDSISLYV